MPSETPEPTQEQHEHARAAVKECDSEAASASTGKGYCCRWHIAKALAAEAAPLREEIERLTKLQEATALERERTGAELAESQDAAEAKVLSLEAEIERLKGELEVAWSDCHDGKCNACAKCCDAALAAASRAREEQGALRAALERWGIIQSHGDEEDGENDGRAYARCRCCGVIAWDGKPIHHKNKCEVGAALAPPAAESQENQQQLTGKGAK